MTAIVTNKFIAKTRKPRVYAIESALRTMCYKKTHIYAQALMACCRAALKASEMPGAIAAPDINSRGVGENNARINLIIIQGARPNGTVDKASKLIQEYFEFLQQKMLKFRKGIPSIKLPGEIYKFESSEGTVEPMILAKIDVILTWHGAIEGQLFADIKMR